MPTAKSNRRLFDRTLTDEEAVLLYDGRHEGAKLRDLSGGGAQLVTMARPNIGTPVTFYADEFGRFEGKIARHTPFGIGLRLDSDPDRMRRITQRLASYAGHVGQQAPLAKGLDAKRVLLETLALSGRIAASRTQWSDTFWQVAMQCQSQGWITTYPINPEFDLVELSPKGRRALNS